MLAAYVIGIASAFIGQTSNLTYDTTYTDGLSNPARLAPAGGGGVYVTDQQLRKIVELDAVGTAVNTYDIPELPVGIAVDPSGAVFISRGDGHVGRYDASFVFQETLDPAPATMVAPNDLVVHPMTGELYVIDSVEHQVLVFADDGGGWALARAWGTEGSGLAEMMTPQAIALDTALDLVIVADTDNFRGQVFDTAGMLVRKFGYRTSYVGMNAVAWVARTAGVAVDSCSNIYLTDALMGTVRAFDSMGQDLDLANPPIGYGANPGELRNPCGLMIESGKLYAASTYNAAVEVFDVACTAGAGRPAGGSIDDSSATTLKPTRKVSRQRVTPPDNPMDIVRAMDEDAYSAALDLNKDRSVDTADLEIAVAKFGAGTADGFLADTAMTAAHPTLAPPHIIELPNRCGRCHSMDGLPGGMLTADGQENLCLSCHTASGVAMGMPIAGGDRGNSHPWGVAATSGGVMGPAPESDLSLHLDNGDIRCGTCHEPHETFEDTDPPYYTDRPYLRVIQRNIELCGECHKEYAEWTHAGHGDEEGEAFVHYDWTQSNRSSCRMCHTGNGFIGFTEGLSSSEQSGEFRTHDCLVCHATHGKPQGEELLRVYGEATLPGDVVVDRGPNAACLVCHNGRYAPNTGHLTPHYLLGGVMLEGINGAEFGATLTSSRHTSVAGCVDCHMADSPANGNPGAGKVGGHSFNMAVHDPEDPDYGFENVDNACNASACHGDTGALTTLNRIAYGDFDGSGTLDGVQDEVQGLLDLVYDEIHVKGGVFLGYYPYWQTKHCVGGLNDGDACSYGSDCDLVAPDDGLGSCEAGADEQLLRDAIWNFEYVDNDGSLGVHNTDYAVGLLQVTYEALTGGPLSGADLRYTPAGLGETVITVTEVIGSSPVEPGGAFSVNFTIENELGDPIAIGDLNRLRLYVAGPATNYQRVIYSDSDPAHFVQNPDDTYTYSGDPFPLVYMAPLNDSLDLTDDELTGDPLLDGTYTVLIESRRVFGSIRKAGDATLDFVVANDPLNPPALASKQVVVQESCNDCHLDLQLHGSNRYSITGCVVCHNTGAEDLATDPPTTVGRTIQFANMIHMIHSGHGLPSIEATQNSGDPYRLEIIGYHESVHDFSDVGFPIIPAGVTDCDACHLGASQGADIYTNHSRLACSGCHDDIDFVAGTVLDQGVPEVCLGGLDDGASCTSDSDCDLLVLDDGLGTCGPDPALRFAGLGTLEEGDLDDPAYRVFPGTPAVQHMWPDDTLCWTCHNAGLLAPVDAAHRHSTDPAVEGTGLAVEILSVAGMTGGGGTYFQVGDVPAITFKLTDSANDPLYIPGTPDTTVIDRLYFMVVGPTTLYQQIIPDERAVNGGAVSADPANWTDHGDGTYTYLMVGGFPADYPAQENTIGQDPADQIFPYAGGWGQQYDALGAPLDTGSYSVMVWGRRVTASGDREPMMTDIQDVPFGAADPIVPWPATVTTEKCNACHGVLAFHGNQREGVQLCAGCHTAGGQDGGTTNGIDLRRMVHKLHNARNLTNLPYELNGYSGVDDFSGLLISAMPGEAAECAACHATDDWKTPPVRGNMRTWMTACTSCHDSAEAAAHADAMTLPGTFVEMCTLCHGDGAAYSVETVHASP